MVTVTVNSTVRGTIRGTETLTLTTVTMKGIVNEIIMVPVPTPRKNVCACACLENMAANLNTEFKTKICNLRIKCKRNVDENTVEG